MVALAPAAPPAFPADAQLRECLLALELAHPFYETAWCLGGGPLTQHLALKGIGHYRAPTLAAWGDPAPLVDLRGYKPGAFLSVGFAASHEKGALWDAPLRPLLLAYPVLGWPHRWFDTSTLGFCYRAPAGKPRLPKLAELLRAAGLDPVCDDVDAAWGAPPSRR